MTPAMVGRGSGSFSGRAPSPPTKTHANQPRSRSLTTDRPQNHSTQALKPRSHPPTTRSPVTKQPATIAKTPHIPRASSCATAGVDAINRPNNRENRDFMNISWWQAFPDWRREARKRIYFEDSSSRSSCGTAPSKISLRRCCR